MELEEIKDLTEQYDLLLHWVTDRRVELADLQAKCQEVEAQVIEEAREAGRIDGGNKDTREAQRAAVLATSEAYAEAIWNAQKAEIKVKRAENDLRVLETRIGLTKAWLYSQARIG
jgi:hypothetical protein